MHDIPWTFGIITVYEDKNRLSKIVQNIRSLGVPEYKILLVGGGDSSGGTAGGLGVVIVRYLTANAVGTTITGGTTTTSGVYTIRTFTASGSLVVA